MNLEHRKYLRPNEVEGIDWNLFGTFAKQSNQGCWLPYEISGMKPKKRKGWIIIYDKVAIEVVLKTKGFVA